MIRKNQANTFLIAIVFILSILLLPQSGWTAKSTKKPLELQDIMKFKQIRGPLISDNGKWVTYSAKPDRGNGQVIAVHTESGKSFTIKRGAKPIITKNGAFVAAAVEPDFAALEKWAGGKDKKNKKKKPKNGLALLDTSSGKISSFEKVKAYKFSDDSRWLFYCLFPAEKKKEDKNAAEKSSRVKSAGDKKAEKKAEKKKEEKKEKKPKTSTLVLRRLKDGKEIQVEKTTAVLFDPSSLFLAYAVYDADDSGRNGLYIIDLKKELNAGRKVHGEHLARYSNMTWSKTKSRLAFIFHKKAPQSNHVQPLEKAKTTKPEDKEYKKGNIYHSALFVWDGAKNKLRDALPRKRLPTGWVLPNENNLSWTKDGERLFFGLKPVDEYLFTHPRKEERKNKDGIYDIKQLLAKRTLDVWHWKDPRINPHQKKQWERLKKRVYTSVYLYKEDRYVRLADKEIRRVERPENSQYTIGYAGGPYEREITWDGRYADVYFVNLWNGTRGKILSRYPLAYRSNVYLSPDGRFLVYYLDKHWYLYSIRGGNTRNLTKSLDVPFYNEDHDYPSDVPGYGIAGWSESGDSVLIYDKYDIWQFPSGKGEMMCLTDGLGRENKMVFRNNRLNPDKKYFKNNQALLLSAYSDEKKYRGFYRCKLGKAGVTKLIEEKDKTYSFKKKAKKANILLFTRENFQEFPDLWVSGPAFKNPKKLSNVNPQKKDFLWGTAELAEWDSFDGKRLQGVVIKPENYDPAKRYPVLVYYYRFSSQRLHLWNQVVVNHRPCFPYYAGNGYVVFLPDIRFEIGRPGLAAAKCLVPGVQKLVDMGIANPKAIGLHGHSWSGYQTAFVITQTDIFAAAVAGAPVSNMTSAYSGIRWGSGMARQFQYEKSQSRIGPSLYDAPHIYFENSPVFYAKRVNTPLLIQFGDKDEAVPWYQGIELYLAMRRLNKDCVFLQYNGEPHHLKKYSNKLDYTIKMKEYFDHYLLGEPAPRWISKGEPYQKPAGGR